MKELSRLNKIFIIISVILLIIGTFIVITNLTQQNNRNSSNNMFIGNLTSNSVTIYISSMPQGAKVEGTHVFYDTLEGRLVIEKINVYDAAGNIVVSSNYPLNWNYVDNENSSYLLFEAGMKIEIFVPSVHIGDVITIVSIEEYYGAMSVTV
jgi:hypothetical protein